MHKIYKKICINNYSIAILLLVSEIELTSFRMKSSDTDLLCQNNNNNNMSSGKKHRSLS